ncbi:DNA-methyltransferase [Haloarchaeobius sp. HRN-SO-5]|uniref:DNA-methyltransferase n=1 Tax=Haloarchaeobius sp. HRN-SO-5 TaxID=3446118 RepID=UPI003EBBAF2A
METEHACTVGDARDMEGLEEDSVDLVVTSPPYPMISMWDETFGSLNPEVRTALESGDGDRAFSLMHEELAAVWADLSRVVRPGGIVCLNVGDATRSLDGSFSQYPNHARVTAEMRDLGFRPLPDVLWRKPTNKASKFMGSGMLPPNAYVTLEHEYVLVFRNGAESRSFEPGSERRYESAYFWEERNDWFSDVWTDVAGEVQDRHVDDAVRSRSGAFPVEIPYRLINMYSVYGDTVLDPFWGTGTTTLAAMLAGRNSRGYELDAGFAATFDDRIEALPERSRRLVDRRLDRHREFVERRRREGETFDYRSEQYDFPVTTKQERTMRFYEVTDVRTTGDGYRVAYRPR